MRSRRRWPSLAATACLAVVVALSSDAAAAACRSPDAAGFVVSYPQGADKPIKLYATRKGGHVGSIEAAKIEGRIEICSEKPESVNEIRIPIGIGIALKEGKSETASGQYWVRSGQVRFKSGNQKKAFDCERNQVKTRHSSGAAGNEECKQ